MQFQSDLHGIARVEAKQRIEHWLNRFELTDRASELCRQLSGGMRRKVELARALLSEPSLLLMDEATVGIDPASRAAIVADVKALCRERGMGVLWATHLVDEAESADRIIVIQEGDQQVEMTQLQAVLRRLMIMAMKGNLDAIRMLLRYAEQMQREDRQLHERFLEQMLKYKVKAEAEVRQRQAKGITDMSDILPHPDHIDADFVTGEVLITGPMSPREAAAIEAGHEALLEHRKALAQLDTVDPKALPPKVRQAVADMRHDIETEIRALSEALGEPYP
jgi:ABC-type multidrug transport system ATPase subunit